MISPLPVILCGHTEKIGVGVIAALQPEIEGRLLKFAHLNLSDMCSYSLHFNTRGGQGSDPCTFKRGERGAIEL